MTQIPPSPPPGSDDAMAYAVPPPRSSGMAIASMVMGILAIPLACLLIGVPLGLTALVLGAVALTQINKQPQELSGKGFAIAGIITGSLACVGFVPLLIAILLPSMGKARELANRGTCAANVRGIAQSMHVYGADNDDVYPIVATPTSNSPPRYKLAADAQAPGFATTDTTFESIYQTNPQKNAGSPQACLWILCIRGDVAPKQFLCKSDATGATGAALLSPAGTYNTNFSDPVNVANSDLHYSYSVAYPWSPDRTKPGPAPWWRATSDASLPLMADMSPLAGTPAGAGASTPGVSFVGVTRFANSMHHQRDGQNISFGDAHAEFERSPFVGQNGDNIYTAGPSGPAFPSDTSNPIRTSGEIPAGWTGGTSGNYDTIMVPAANADTHARF